MNFYRDLLDRLNSSPGVKSAGTAAVREGRDFTRADAKQDATVA